MMKGLPVSPEMKHTPAEPLPTLRWLVLSKMTKAMVVAMVVEQGVEGVFCAFTQQLSQTQKMLL